ncbi:MFS transporter [Dolosigranulum pigrum]|uniref:V-type ATP synthase subunit I n=1 Tax=Dolosigranulum pigrum TaxID=29394 RepID=UPI000DBF7355|nr:V-type ATP synthase subunit I [Dolosigranulum pigrum]RAN60670.1 MFS transporter [Dolosigranulum pigrum]
MAIAKLKKLTLIARQRDKDLALKSVQKMQNIEVAPLPEMLEDELLEGLSVESSKDSVAEVDNYLNDLRYALKFTDQYTPSLGLIEGLRQKRQTYTMAELDEAVSEEHISEILQEISDKEESLNKIDEKKRHLREEESFFRRWKNLDYLPSELNDFQLMDVKIGSINVEYIEQFKEVLADYEQVFYEEIYRNSDTTGFYVVYPQRNSQEVTSILAQNGFQALSYEYEDLPAQELEKNLAKRKELIAQKKEVIDQLKGFKEQQTQLELAEEYYYNLSEREKAKELLVNSKQLVMISGWADVEDIDDITSTLTTGLDGDIAILTEEIKEEDYEKTPTKLNHNALLKPFALLVEMFSFPKYGELDPTAWIAPFFFIFFGMMSADAGYGIVLFLGTFVGLKFFELGRAAEQNLRFFMYNSVSTIIFGLIFGSFFGMDLPFRLLSLQDDIIPLLVISIVLGVLHVILGFQLGAYLKHKNGNHLEAYINDHAWSLIIIGSMVYAAGITLDVPPVVETIGIGLIAVNAVGIIIASMINQSSIFGGLGMGLFSLTDVSSITGDIVSYSRIMALGVASANIGMAFNLLISYLPPVFRFTLGILLFVALHFLNIFIAFLGAYVHSLRLHYVEMFGKFYEGGGRPFKPLKTLEKHIWLKQ